MKNKTLRPFLALILFALGFVSCTKEDLLGNNEFEDGNGVKVSLTWTVNSGNAVDSADLDLVLYQGTGANLMPTNITSEFTDSFELIVMPSDLLDGEYTIAVDHYDVIRGGMMTLTFQGMGGSKKYDISGKTFVETDEGSETYVAKVKKSGNKFTITAL
jgi:hypothetical protein